MSSLKPVEKRFFEGLFQMGSGYVLDFTNQTFAEFFRDTLSIDIYDAKYAFNGGSKAKRLRAFWEVESDTLVGKALSEMLDVKRYDDLTRGGSSNEEQVKEAHKIIARLLGKPIKEVDPLKQFLDKDFGDIPVDKLPIEPTLIPVIKGRVSEASKCLKSGASLSVIFMCGSILEGILLGVAIQKPEKFNRAASAPVDKNGKVKILNEWTLSQLIDVACELGFIQLDVKKFSHALREFRNYIHPYQQMASKFEPDEHTADICMQVLKAAISGLSGKRKK